MDKIRAIIVARPLLSAIVLAVGGIVVEWLTAFLKSIQAAPV